jgi:hypothetical protein
MPLDLAPEVFIPAAALGELFRRRTLLGSANYLPVGFQRGGFPEGRILGVSVNEMTTMRQHEPVGSTARLPFSSDTVPLKDQYVRDIRIENQVRTLSARWPPKQWIVRVPAATSPLCGIPLGMKYSSPAFSGVR